MSEPGDTTRDPRRRPSDPAGTQPKHDPSSLLPATREPLLPEPDIVDADVVEEADPSLLPARRPAAVPAAVAADPPSAHAPRFQFLLGALVAVGVAALIGVAALVLAPAGSERGGLRWSAWRPSKGGVAGAQQIAEHVARRYRLPDGRQIVDVSVTPLEIQGIPLAVAVRETAAEGGDIRVFDDGGLIYRLCGLGPDCAIATGRPSGKRHLLLRREALELVLYSFRYVEGVKSIVVFMPPVLGQKPSQALFFREGDVTPELQRPLTASLAPEVPSVRNVTLSPDTPLIDQVTSPRVFRFSLTQANTDNRGFIVLDPFKATPERPVPPSSTPERQRASSG